MAKIALHAAYKASRATLDAHIKTGGPVKMFKTKMAAKPAPKATAPKAAMGGKGGASPAKAAKASGSNMQSMEGMTY